MRTLLLFISIGLIAMGCLESYSPPKSNNDINYLAISANLDATNGIIQVSLSRALPLDHDAESFPKINNAIITLKGSDGSMIDVPSAGTDGVYTHTHLTIDKSLEYALNIKTDGQEYESEYIKITQSPPIENVSFERGLEGINIVLTTKDPTNQSRYYKWEFVETYIEQAPVYSRFYFNDSDTTVRARSIDQLIHVCYDHTISSKITIATTERLVNDIVNRIPITTITKNSPKLQFGYSILIKQRVLTKEAFTYYEKLKISTESLGGLFDPQPSSVLGNFKNINNNNEPVLGYFSGGEEMSYRFFIHPSDLPNDLRPNIPTPYCPTDTLWIDEIKTFINKRREFVIADDLRTMDGEILAYTYVDLNCGDCRKKGGTTTRPDFWPN
jgi:hypothetical protein